MLKLEGLQILKNLPEEMNINNKVATLLRKQVLGQFINSKMALTIISETDGFRKPYPEYIDIVGNLAAMMKKDPILKKISKEELIILLIDPYEYHPARRETAKGEYDLALTAIIEKGSFNSEMSRSGLDLKLTAKSGRKYNLTIRNLQNYPILQRIISEKLQSKGREDKDKFVDYLLDQAPDYNGIVNEFESLSGNAPKGGKIIISSVGDFTKEDAARGFITALDNLINLSEDERKNLNPKKLQGLLEKHLGGRKNYQEFIANSYTFDKNFEGYKELERLGLLSLSTWVDRAIGSDGPGQDASLKK